MPICTQGMQRTWWPEAGTIIVTGPYWNIRNSPSYAATATKIRLHFQFPRPLTWRRIFGDGWLLNWKFKFGCRRISNIANHVKCNYFWDDDGIDNVTLRLWKISNFCSRRTVGVAGDDIMYHILVCGWSLHFPVYGRIRELVNQSVKNGAASLKHSIDG